jgi:hypothetical protein
LGQIAHGGVESLAQLGQPWQHVPSGIGAEVALESGQGAVHPAVATNEVPVPLDEIPATWPLTQ